jgi:hypothetical protein
MKRKKYVKWVERIVIAYFLLRPDLSWLFDMIRQFRLSPRCIKRPSQHPSNPSHSSPSSLCLSPSPQTLTTSPQICRSPCASTSASCHPPTRRLSILSLPLSPPLPPPLLPSRHRRPWRRTRSRAREEVSSGPPRSRAPCGPNTAAGRDARDSAAPQGCGELMQVELLLLAGLWPRGSGIL